MASKKDHAASRGRSGKHSKERSSPTEQRLTNISYAVAGLIFILSMVLFVVFSWSRGAAPADESFTILKTWIIEHGGNVHPGLRTALVSHGGLRMRGLVTDVSLSAGITLFSIPKKLWLTSSALSLPSAVNPDGIRACAGENIESLSRDAAVALETRKLNRSAWYPMLRFFSSLQDYKEFHPLLAESPTIVDFGELPLLRDLVEDFRLEFDSVKACFEAWKQASGSDSLLATVVFEDILASRFHVKTRSITEQVLVPMFDLANTGASTNVNMKHRVNHKTNMYDVVTTKRVPAGSEIVNSYCDKCDNEGMLAGWGVYLEDNDAGLNSLGTTDCTKLKQVAEAELDLTPQHIREALEAKWKSPRCKASNTTDDRDQAPLRCSLARLAWEACAKDWAHPWWVRSRAEASDTGRMAHAKAHSNIGVVLASKGKTVEAVERFKAAVRILPSQAQARNNLARLQKQLGT